MAIKDTNVGWQKIHRVQYITRLSMRESSYNVACGLKVQTVDKVYPLSSGRLLGVRCSACWHFLPTAESVRQATVDELNAMLLRLQPLTDAYAVKLARDCWNCIADLGMGCHCEEAAHTLVLSAGHWLERAAA
ncbi:hypothetical protein [Mycobacterium sp.]|uniref:hypothetical protein n=1 Tax=Mycobacterium sp. TaxID=1785 RepID=UPI002F3F829A